MSNSLRESSRRSRLSGRAVIAARGNRRLADSLRIRLNGRSGSILERRGSWLRTILQRSEQIYMLAMRKILIEEPEFG